MTMSKPLPHEWNPEPEPDWIPVFTYGWKFIVDQACVKEFFGDFDAVGDAVNPNDVVNPNG